ncbi:hypothetical protein SAMN06265360_110120 [Haloechinothrix alba]|uniref:Uncharacterized protein n=1 Tax=Haloechinothrix alba TaxID=664784 RepID=A0A238XDH5_9PSEU|nr:hypothetical protein SAMN06265360_110120 [Haloechinothrix alba]
MTSPDTREANSSGGRASSAPLWLAGRIAQYGRVLFDDDPRARVAWQADARVRYLDEMPVVRARYAERLSRPAHWADR